MSFKDRWYKEKQRKAARKAVRRKKSISSIGLAWYSREQWEALTKIEPNRSDLDGTYEEWEIQATKTLQMLADQGVHAVKVDMDVEALVEWCQSEDRQPDRKSRAAFVSYLLSTGQA